MFQNQKRNIILRIINNQTIQKKNCSKKNLSKGNIIKQIINPNNILMNTYHLIRQMNQKKNIRKKNRILTIILKIINQRNITK